MAQESRLLGQEILALEDMIQIRTRLKNARLTKSMLSPQDTLEEIEDLKRYAKKRIPTRIAKSEMFAKQADIVTLRQQIALIRRHLARDGRQASEHPDHPRWVGKERPGFLDYQYFRWKEADDIVVFADIKKPKEKGFRADKIRVLAQDVIGGAPVYVIAQMSYYNRVDLEVDFMPDIEARSPIDTYRSGRIPMSQMTDVEQRIFSYYAGKYISQIS